VAPGDYAITERGSHHRVWSRVSYETNRQGRVWARTNAYTELATGMHYRNERGEWTESVPGFELEPGWAVARRGAHQVALAADARTYGGVDIRTPDNQRLRSHVLGLSYLDTSSGQAVLIAETTNCVGQLLPSGNEVLYANAFTDFRADLLYTYTKAGFRQDVILREQPPGPELFGLNPQTTRLQVLTEFVEASEPVKVVAAIGERGAAQEPLSAVTNGVAGKDILVDEQLRFGAMKMGRGRAFTLGADDGRGRALPVVKRWQQMSGRQFLVEEVRWRALTPELRALPPSQVYESAARNAAPFAQRCVPAEHVFPPAPGPREPSGTLLLASSAPPTAGFVVDYNLDSYLADFTFQGDTTYYASGWVDLEGTTTFEGGAVVKFNGTAAGLTIWGPVVCRTGPYRPVVFTSKSDNSVGAWVAGGTPAVWGSVYGGVYLFAGSQVELDNVRFAYAACGLGVESYYDGGVTLRNAQFVNSGMAVWGYGSTVNLYNVLIASGTAAFHFEDMVSTVGQNLTVCGLNRLLLDPGVSEPVPLYNSLLVALANDPAGGFGGSHNENLWNQTAGSVFQSKGAGDYYLADYSPHRDQGTTSIEAKLLADLRRKTTYRPLDGPSGTLTTSATLLPQALRDTNTPDLGYHYDPIDYAIGAVTLANASLNLAEGVVVCVYGGGIQVNGGATLSGLGRPLARTVITRHAAVQEQPAWPGTTFTGLPLVTIADQGSVDLSFVTLSLASAPVGQRYAIWVDHEGASVSLRNCEVFTGTVDVAAEEGGSPVTVILNNCLFWRSWLSLHDVEEEFSSALELTMHNNLLLGGNAGFGHGNPASSWSIRDNAFDHLTLSGYHATDFSHNAYISTSGPASPPPAADKVLTDLAYATGPLGDYYQLETSPLVNAGSRSTADAGLYHYTTQIPQTKEADSTVDIGFHYVALEATLTETVWVEDAIPAGAVPMSHYENWSWISANPAPYSGSQAHASTLWPDWHQHYFEGASVPLAICPADVLFCYVYLNPVNPPQEVMLQWMATDWTWWYHRAYWGADEIDWEPRTYMGPLPAAGGWVRLEVPASAVDLAGRAISGMAFTLFGGTATWDRAGVVGYTYGLPVDTDGDGLADYLEDANGNGVVDTGETDPASVDTDYDGRSDAQEVEEGTSPTNPNDARPVKLGSWSFDGGNYSGDQGQQPLAGPTANLSLESSFSGTAVRIPAINTSGLQYQDLEVGGSANMNCRHGSVRFWFKPAWTSTRGGVTGGPRTYGRVLEVGGYGVTGGWWSLLLNPDGTQLSFMTAGNLQSATHITLPIDWSANEWHQVVLTYASSGTAVYIDGQLKATGSGVANYPDAATRAQKGFRIGYEWFQAQSPNGQFDKVETFNYCLSATDIHEEYTWSWNHGDPDGDGLTNLEESKLGTDPLQPNVALPAFNPVGQSYASAQNVVITCPTAGATVRYTLDGQEPTESDPVADPATPILVDHSLTLKAKAWKTGWVTSETESQGYCIEATPANQPPTVSIAPPTGSSFLVSDDIEILVQASDPDGSVVKVQLFRDGLKLAEAGRSPLRYTLETPPPGIHTYTAKAVDNVGAVALTLPATITIAVSGPVVGLQGESPFFTSSPGNLLATVVGVSVGNLISLTLNGAALPVQAGTFNISAALTEGENTFTLVATDDQGRTAQATTKVVLDSIAPAVSITEPANSASFDTTSINVRGSFTESALRRITVNGVLAFVDGATFEARNVPLSPGANTITATAEDLAGNTGTAAITVTGGEDPATPVQLEATPVAGVAPLQVTFQVQATVPGTLQQVIYDFDGDGGTDQTATDLQPVTHTYSTAGEYFPVATVVTSVGRFSSAGGWHGGPDRLRINVQSAPIVIGTINVTDPVDLKWMPGDMLYVLSRSSATLTEFNSGGSVVRSLAGIGTTPTGLDVDSAGNVYVALNGDHQVAKFSPTTSSFQPATFGTSGRIGGFGTGDGQFNGPFDVAVTPDGENIYVSDSGNHRIQQFTQTGTFVRKFGSQGSGIAQLNTPKGLTCDGAGYLFIVDAGNSRIALTLASSVIGASGTSGSALGQFSGAIHLGVGTRGIYVADTGNNRVQAFAPVRNGDGVSPTPFHPRLALSTQLGLSQPHAVAPKADFLEEIICIADTGNHRVIKVRLPETSTPEATWNAMKASLLAGNIDQAVTHFSLVTREAYRRSFTAIGQAAICSVMDKTVTPAVINGDSAQYYFEDATVIPGETITFPVEFVKENGIWKIMEF
jgi:hypothetical protein